MQLDIQLLMKSACGSGHGTAANRQDKRQDKTFPHTLLDLHWFLLCKKSIPRRSWSLKVPRLMNFGNLTKSRKSAWTRLILSLLPSNWWWQCNDFFVAPFPLPWDWISGISVIDSLVGEQKQLRVQHLLQEYFPQCVSKALQLKLQFCESKHIQNLVMSAAQKRIWHRLSHK